MLKELNEGENRLLRLADKLDGTGPYRGQGVPKDFYMGIWDQCALGQAAKDKWFNERGFVFRGNHPALKGKDVRCVAAGAEFFGLTYTQAERLFCSTETIGSSAREMAQGIRKVVADGRVRKSVYYQDRKSAKEKLKSAMTSILTFA